jgi:peptidoglycan/xylan/chitin deacetylase (PgdA/CDA1 family)
MLKSGWEIASHGYRWIDYQHFSPKRWSASTSQGHRDAREA